MTNSTTLSPASTIQGTWTVDPIHSSAQFSVPHMGLTPFVGSFSPIDASVTADGDTITINGSVAVDSIDVEQEDLRAHLLSPEFFDAAQYPTINFNAHVQHVGDDVQLDGTLTLRGQERPITVIGKLHGPVAGPMGNKIGLSIQTVIDRRDWGLDWQVELPGGALMLAWEIAIIVNLELAEVTA